ncbi:MAG: coagulation factor 5/8 type domain protein [Paenibacillus sp.]|jgi:hypothetical protein|nr:coagulation factor 5/8 type domain protein [Paenibacillus sp.]
MDRKENETLVGKLRAEHPRLIAAAADFERVRRRIPSDPICRRWYEALKEQAEVFLENPPSSYEFPDGRTLLRISRQVLSRTYTLAMMYQLDGDSRYAERLWTELETVASFSDWNPVSFLSTAEMTHAFAIGYDWLYRYWTAARQETLERAIVQLGLRPGLEGYQNGAWWTVTKNNWNIVTNSGLGMGSLAVGDKAPELAETLLQRGLNAMPLAIAEYGPDGAYPESIGYWAYATRYLVPYMAALVTATGSDCGLSRLPGLDRTGSFPLYMSGPDGKPFHYYDGDSAPPRVPELFWLGNTYGKPVYGWWALQGDGATPFHLLWYDPANIQSPTETGFPTDAYFRRSEVVSFRSDWHSPLAVFAAFKGGLNGANHGDLDLGTFVLDALGQRWAEELGSENYSMPGYWKDGPEGQRSTYYRKRAEGQNTLVVQPGAGADQDIPARGAIIRFESGTTASFAIAELTEAYASRGVASWQRGMKLLDDRSRVLIQDELVADAPVEAWWFMHTHAAIAIAPGRRSATLTASGQRLAATLVSSDPHAVFTVREACPLPSSPHPSHQSDNADMRKLSIRLHGDRLTLAVLLSPMRPGDAAPSATPLEDMSAWTLP